MKHLIAPSVLAANYKNLEKDFAMVNQSEADWFHVDIMDGRFVPNISFGMFIVKQMKEMAERPLDVHLMIVEPEKYVEQFREAGADVITVHYEACNHLHRTIQQIKDTGAKAGVALNPHTPVHLLEDIIEDLDLVCLMSVNPKVRKLKELIETRNTKTLIEIDGGVGLQNAESLLKAGANVLEAGSAVFKSENPIDTISRMKAIRGLVV